MKKSKLYTKSGDKGETSLVSGTRISKADKQIELYGELDTLNSHIGYLFSLIREDNIKDDVLKRSLGLIQNTLFDLGSLLACEVDSWEKFKLKLISENVIQNLEEAIDFFDGEVPALKNFILPGGAKSAAYAHVTRTHTRKVERLLISYKNNNNIVPENSIELMNRLSDFFFVVARFLNIKLGEDEILWSGN